MDKVEELKIMNDKIITEFRKMLFANTPIICIEDYDFVRVDEMICKAAGITDTSQETEKVLEWNPASGPTKFIGRNTWGIYESLDTFLDNRYSEEDEEPIMVVLKDVQYYLDNDPRVRSLLHLMAQRKLYDEKHNKTVIIVSAAIKIPKEIEKYASYLEIGYVDNEDEVANLIKERAEANGIKYDAISENVLSELKQTLKGMTRFEIDRMLDIVISHNGELVESDQESLKNQKKKRVHQSGLLELVEKPNNLNEIGGLENLKEYLKKKEQIFNAPEDDIAKRRLSIPKGILIVGMPGCGKSLCAKAAANSFKAPLLKLDMGTLMGKYVGESEANLKEALAIAQATAPCILWIDEMEKVFAGSDGKGGSDVMVRMYGYFLSWMQENESKVYVIATANNAERIPPELKRKGRFDEIFCVNLPNEEERKSIFKVHLGKKIQKEELADKLANNSRLIAATEGFCGADIEAVVCDANDNLYINKSVEELSIDDLIRSANNTVSISMSCKEQINAMEEIFRKSTFKNASKNNHTDIKDKTNTQASEGQASADKS